MFAQIAILALMAAVVSSASVSTNPTQAQLDANDILVLRYAATLENLEANFYNTFHPLFTTQNYIDAGFDANVMAALGLIRSHENAHAAYLNSVLGAYNSSFVTPMCGSYAFPAITNVSDYLYYARIFENIGVNAYTGAVDEIYNSSLLTAAATIATIEARHAGFLNGLAGIPIPTNNVDTALKPVTVGGMISKYLVNCSYNVAAQFPQTFQIIPVTTNITSNPNNYQLTQNDIAALNYALYLENLESAFYKFGQAQFNSSEFARAGYNGSVYSNFALISAHEDAHVSALQGAVTGLGGSPIPACVYNFGTITTVAQYVATAQLLENTGVEAYDGALPTIYDNTLKTIAATIATIEARHAAYLNKLAQSTTYQGFVSRDAQGLAYDKATTPGDIYTAVQGTGLITSCPVTPALPAIIRVFPANNGTAPSTSSSSTTARSTTGTTTTRSTTGTTSKSTSTSTSGASNTSPAGSPASVGAAVSFVLLAVSVFAVLA